MGIGKPCRLKRPQYSLPETEMARQVMQLGELMFRQKANCRAALL
jgi:hypothetical protein